MALASTTLNLSDLRAGVTGPVIAPGAAGYAPARVVLLCGGDLRPNSKTCAGTSTAIPIRIGATCSRFR